MNITCNTNNQKINEYNVCYNEYERPLEQIGFNLLLNKLEAKDEEQIKDIENRIMFHKLEYFEPEWSELDYKQQFLHEWIEEDVSWIPINEDDEDKEWRMEKCRIVDNYDCYSMNEIEVDDWLEGYGISDIQFFIYQETHGSFECNPTAYAVFL